MNLSFIYKLSGYQLLAGISFMFGKLTVLLTMALVLAYGAIPELKLYCQIGIGVSGALILAAIGFTMADFFEKRKKIINEDKEVQAAPDSDSG